METSYVDIPGYWFYRGDVFGSIAKHGVGVYVSKSLDKPDEISVDIPNVLVLEFGVIGLYFVGCYCPPSYFPQENAGLVNYLFGVPCEKSVVLTGDFNLPTISWDSEGSLNGGVSQADGTFLDVFLTMGLKQWVWEPTFVSSGNTLDLLWTSDHDIIGEIATHPPFPHCGHNPVSAELFLHMEGDPGGHGNVKLWFRGDYESISEVLYQLDWDTEFEGLTVDGMYDRFVFIVAELVEQYIPTRSCGESVPRWMGPPPRALGRERSRLWREYKLKRSELGRDHLLVLEALDRFNGVNRDYRNYSMDRQWRYELNLIRNFRSAPKLFHSYIRSRKRGKTVVGPLKVDGIVYGGDREVAELLADTFSAVYTSGAPLVNPIHQQSAVEMEALEISYEAVLSSLRALKSASSAGPDGVHPHLLKSCAEAFALPLAIIFGESLRSGFVPSCWRRSLISPLFKSGTRCSPSNYRPVSITSVPCKTMERIIGNHITAFLETNSLLSPHQFGFRAGHSTEDQLLLFYNEIARRIDAGGCADVLFLDFSKAFDVISHVVLLDKIGSLLFHPQIVGWVRSFLSGRTMNVSVSGVLSSVREVTSGVPQGSVLGPLLFLVYVNYLMHNSRCYWKAFADDFKLCAVVDRVGQGLVLQEELNSIEQKCLEHQLILNRSKCVVMRFGDKSFLPRPVYFLGGVQLSVVDTYKDLGIKIDPKLKFHNHVRAVVGRAGGLMSEFLRSTVCRAPDFMVSLFAIHIRPIIEYCSSVWNVGYMGDIRLLESLQRRWSREIAGCSHLSYEDRLVKLDLFSVAGRLLRADLIKMWKAFHCEIDVGLPSMLSRATYPGTRGHRFKLVVLRANTDILRRSWSFRSVNIWNSLPASVVECESLTTFKRLLTRQLGESLYKPLP